ncbi:hypothetical protein OJ996_03265 [Luteolibacter sp. GHJ8]|uniref:N-acetyltransferase domain-containing protein n=1 Tax=Luteolibacter rhizosphaerae TaxID=2989719 RepID=A0ABT3FYB9_9BACT|nr:hypothetical protein [Luteolibacter rhizosphaerae]MCW1912578.1 hypothetical protein [Luteolibacter rhizosphaerae]
MVLVCLLGIPSLLFLFVLGTYSGHTQATLRFLGGFYFFLRENLPRISSNAATWVPGIGAFFFGTVGIHLLFAKQAKRRGLPWCFGTSFALASIVPALFVIAFLVPGILLQLRAIARDPDWFRRESSIASSLIVHDYQRIGIGLFEYSSEHEGRFPDSLEALAQQSEGGEAMLYLKGEPPIYLGIGLTERSDPGLPLLISPEFSDRGIARRLVRTVGWDEKFIPSAEADVWISRALEARRKLPKE